MAMLAPAWQVLTLPDERSPGSASTHHPGLVITDRQHAVRVLASSQRRIGEWDVAKAQWLVVSDALSSASVREALDRGVLGYVDTGCPLSEIDAAVRTVACGRRYLCRTAATLLADRWLGDGLTPRELDVLKMLCFGLDNKSIGARLGVGPGTVKTHVKTLMQKMRVRNRTQAAIEGVQRGLLNDMQAAEQQLFRP